MGEYREIVRDYEYVRRNKRHRAPGREPGYLKVDR